jgi:glycosyltransferase involved in cell wall biosynthesis
VAGASETGPLVTVIVPVLDDADGLERCLTALETQDLATPWEIVVADNGSREPPDAVVARSSRARMVREPVRSSYAARNAALRVARGPFLAFTDADCSPDPTWLRRGVEVLEARAALDAVAGQVVVTTRDRDNANAAELFEIVHGFQQSRYVAEYGFGATANLFVRRAAVEGIGGFDPSLASGGDAELCQRLSAAGGVVVYHEDVVVRHPARASLRAILRKTRRVICGREELRRRRGGPRRTVRGELITALRNIRRYTGMSWRDERLDRTWDRIRVLVPVVLVQLTTAYEVLRVQRTAARSTAGV